MNMYLVPISNEPNQTFTCYVPVGKDTRIFEYKLSYNAVAQYWTMSVKDEETGEDLLRSVPLLTGEYPATNLLEQYSYMGIGSAVIVPVGITDKTKVPDDNTLGTNFLLVWSDTL